MAYQWKQIPTFSIAFLLAVVSDRPASASGATSLDSAGAGLSQEEEPASPAGKAIIVIYRHAKMRPSNVISLDGIPLAVMEDKDKLTLDLTPGPHVFELPRGVSMKDAMKQTFNEMRHRGEMSGGTAWLIDAEADTERVFRVDFSSWDNAPSLSEVYGEKARADLRKSVPIDHQRVNPASGVIAEPMRREGALPGCREENVEGGTGKFPKKGEHLRGYLGPEPGFDDVAHVIVTDQSVLAVDGAPCGPFYSITPTIELVPGRHQVLTRGISSVHEDDLFRTVRFDARTHETEVDVLAGHAYRLQFALGQRVSIEDVTESPGVKDSLRTSRKRARLWGWAGIEPAQKHDTVAFLAGKRPYSVSSPTVTAFAVGRKIGLGESRSGPFQLKSVKFSKNGGELRGDVQFEHTGQVERKVKVNVELLDAAQASLATLSAVADAEENATVEVSVRKQVASEALASVTSFRVTVATTTDTK